jgi:hypothetical protein
MPIVGSRNAKLFFNLIIQVSDGDAGHDAPFAINEIID